MVSVIHSSIIDRDNLINYYIIINYIIINYIIILIIIIIIIILIIIIIIILIIINNNLDNLKKIKRNIIGYG